MKWIGIELTEISIVKNGLARFMGGILKFLAEMAVHKKPTVWPINVKERIGLLKISPNYWYHAALSELEGLCGLIKQ